MNHASTKLAPYARLLWKEYRAIRGFWISLVALVVLIQLITIAFSQDARDSMGLIYNFALGAPAFFAIGCAGAAFAMEREEGTFEFLRAGPATSGQTFICKLVLTICATLAMLCLLLPIAVWFMRGQLPEASVFHGMLGLWLVAALEAIAWGTLFSLLTARPLLAICLAIAAASTAAHLLAWSNATGQLSDFSYARYLEVAPWRLFIAGLVFAVDVYLGQKWLHGVAEVKAKPKSPRLRAKSPAETVATPDKNIARSLSKKSDRSTMLAQLLWQNWRQSRRIMAVMLGLVLIARLVARMLEPIRHHELLVGIPMGILASLMGSCVFLADQEQRRFRFFVEHNVPARYVWISRLSIWLGVAAIVTSLFVWISISTDEWLAWKEAIRSMTNYWYQEPKYYSWGPYFELAPVITAIGYAAVSFAAGQWASMFVRSGLMAAFLGLLLSAVLCGWVLLIYVMRISFVWAVLPIPLALLFATWLRAPDWVRENARWSARLKAVATLLIPAALLLPAVANYRVDQIPLVDPGFDPEAYLAEITPEALATGELYRRASDSYVPNYEDAEDQDLGFFAHGRRTLNKADFKWIKNNAKTLELILEAAEQPECAIENPQTINQWTLLPNEFVLTNLVVASGRELENEGKLIEAMERYFVALKVISQLNSHRMSNIVRWPGKNPQQIVLLELSEWAADPAQTSARILAAVKRLDEMSINFLRLDDGSKSLFIVARRFLSGDENAAFVFMVSYGKGKVELKGSRLWSMLMPWENQRAIRMLDVLTNATLSRSKEMEEILAEQGKASAVLLAKKWDIFPAKSTIGVNDVLPLYHRSPLDYFLSQYPGRHGSYQMARAEWMSTTNPDMSEVGSRGIETAHEMAEFEADRRATMIILALEAFRLDHGKLPKTLAELVGPYLEKLPLDPFSGKDFVYLPAGLPQPADEMEADAYRERKIAFGKPGIWSIGSELKIATREQPDQKDAASGKITAGIPVEYYTLRRPGYEGRLPDSEIWSSGLWFPIPERRN